MNGETLRVFFTLQIKTRTLWRHTINTVRALNMCERHRHTHTRIIHQHFDAISMWKFLLMICIRQRCFSRHHRFGKEIHSLFNFICVCVSVYLLQFSSSSISRSANAVKPTQSNYAHHLRFYQSVS